MPWRIPPDPASAALSEDRATRGGAVRHRGKKHAAPKSAFFYDFAGGCGNGRCGSRTPCPRQVRRLLRPDEDALSLRGLVIDDERGTETLQVGDGQAQIFQ